MSSNEYYNILFHKNINTTTAIKCTKCGSLDVVVVERATRSADEGVTLFITCKQCNNVTVDQGQ